MKRLIKKIFIFLIILAISGGGLFYYNKYKAEKLKRLAEEEKRRQEELEKEKQKKLLEEKRRQYEQFVSEIEKYFKEKKDYKKTKELIDEAQVVAKKYNFPIDRINEILRKMEINEYLTKLKKLERENEDIYKYFYVRSEIQKIPDFKEIRPLKEKIIEKTYENEYKVKLITAKNLIEEGKQKADPVNNYFLSKKLYLDCKNLRNKENIEKDRIEDEIENMQNDLYFSFEKLYKNTIPIALY